MTAHLFALCEGERGGDYVRHVPLSQQLQAKVETNLSALAQNLIGDRIKEVRFSPIDVVQDGESFFFKDFELPGEIRRAAEHPEGFDALDIRQEKRVRTVFLVIVGARRHGNEVYFQAFDKRQLLVRGTTLLLRGDTYQELTEPGLTLGDKIDAAYVDGRLLFRSYKTVSQFLELSNYLNEATDSVVMEVIDHKVFHVENKQAVLNCADSIIRKRIAAIHQSNILNRVTPKKLQQIGREYDVTVQTKTGKIVFPDTRTEIKKLLRLITEGYFKGEITGDKYEATAQRKL